MKLKRTQEKTENKEYHCAMQRYKVLLGQEKVSKYHEVYKRSSGGSIDG